MDQPLPSATRRGPSPTPSRVGPGLFSCLALLLLLPGGCGAIVEDAVNSSLGLDTKVERRLAEVPETRDWVMEYREIIHFTATASDTEVHVNGEPIGLCPVTAEVRRGTFAVNEVGFYRVAESYRVKDPAKGPSLFSRDERLLKTERVAPTRWIGHRRITPSFTPVVIEWVRDNQPVATLTLPVPPAGQVTDFADPVARAALQKLTWNQDGNQVPGLATGRRDLTEGQNAHPPSVTLNGD